MSSHSTNHLFFSLPPSSSSSSFSTHSQPKQYLPAGESVFSFFLFCLFNNLIFHINTNRSLLFSLLKWVFNFPFPSNFFYLFRILLLFFSSVSSSPFLFGACMHDSRSVLRILIIISWIPAGLIFLFFGSLFVCNSGRQEFFFWSVFLYQREAWYIMCSVKAWILDGFSLSLSLASLVWSP